MVSVTGNGLGQPHLMPHQKENMIQESKIQNNRRIPNYCLLRQLRDQMQILNIRNRPHYCEIGLQLLLQTL